MVETVFALCLFMMPENKLIEHRIQPNLSTCIERKRQSLRSANTEKTDWRCGSVSAEIKINNDGSKTIDKIISAK